MSQGYTDFEFDLPSALLARLIDVFDELLAAPLTLSSLQNVPEAQGVYQLFLNDQLVYIGKTDADAGLRKRLERHQQKIQHRTGLNPIDISFKAVRIYVFTAVDLETQLIAHYGGFSKVQWNGSGFGSNDPGRERDTTKYKDDHFDMLYPIDIDRDLDISFPTSDTAAQILIFLKKVLPYVFRFENATARSRYPHPDLVNTIVTLPSDIVYTPRKVISSVVLHLPIGWQAIRLPSHIILYKEQRFYPQGEVIIRS